MPQRTPSVGVKKTIETLIDAVRQERTHTAKQLPVKLLLRRETIKAERERAQKILKICEEQELLSYNLNLDFSTPDPPRDISPITPSNQSTLRNMPELTSLSQSDSMSSPFQPSMSPAQRAPTQDPFNPVNTPKPASTPRQRGTPSKVSRAASRTRLRKKTKEHLKPSPLRSGSIQPPGLVSKFPREFDLVRPPRLEPHRCLSPVPIIPRDLIATPRSPPVPAPPSQPWQFPPGMEINVSAQIILYTLPLHRRGRVPRVA